MTRSPINLDADGELLEDALVPGEVLESEKAKADGRQLARANKMGCFGGFFLLVSLPVICLLSLLLEPSFSADYMLSNPQDMVVGTWEAEGDWIIYECRVGGYEVYAKSLTTGGTVHLLLPSIRGDSLERYEQTSIAFTVQQDFNEVGQYVLGPGNRNLTALEDNADQSVQDGSEPQEAVSQSGKYALVSQEARGRKQIFLEDVDAGTLENITGGGDVNPFDPVFSPDESDAAFFIGVSENNTGKYKIRVVNLEDLSHQDVPIKDGCVPNNPVWLSYDD